MKKRNRRKFTPEFKIEAIKMVDESDKTIAEISRELGINSNLIGRWKRELSNQEIEASFVDDKDAEIRRLQAELRDLKEDHAIVKKGGSILCQAQQVKYAFIRDENGNHSIGRLCRVMGVSTSGYYDWRNRKPSAHAQRDQALFEMIKDSFDRSHGIYGSPRVHDDLKALSEPVGAKRVARLMQENKLIARCVKAFKRTTITDATLPFAINVLNQDFTAEAINKRWVSDITYIGTEQGWLYLAVVMDLYSRAIVGWAMDKHMDTELIASALNMAITNRRPEANLVLHSDRGSQYSSEAYQTLLAKQSIQCSMSGVGNCYDNAAMESFFHSLKTEWVNHSRYETRAEARSHIFHYIEVFYNRQRRHSFSDRMPPMMFETMAIAA